MEPNSNHKVIGFPISPEASTNSKLANRWGGHEEFFARPEGWVGIPDLFLRAYSKMKPYSLTTGEAMFVLQLMAHKWSEKAPFPSYAKLAKRMGLTDKMVRRYAGQLEEKGYLRRTARIGSTNAFDLTALFTALQVALNEERETAVAS